MRGKSRKICHLDTNHAFDILNNDMEKNTFYGAFWLSAQTKHHISVFKHSSSDSQENYTKSSAARHH